MTQDTHETHLPAEQATSIIGVLVVLLCRCVPLFTGTHLGPHHEPMRLDSDGDNYESIATLLAVSSDCSIRQSQNTHYSYLSRTRTGTICDMSLFMHEIDGSE